MGIVTKIVTEAVKPVERIITKEGRRLVPLAKYKGVPNLSEREILKITKNNQGIRRLQLKAEELYSELQKGLFGDLKVKTEKELQYIKDKIAFLQEDNMAIRGIDKIG